MSSTSTSFQVSTYSSSLLIPVHVFDALQRREPNANCILPTLLKSRELESKGESPPQPQTWITCSSKNHIGKEVVDLIFSITEGYIDSHPLFIFSSLPSHELSSDYVIPRMEKMVKALFQLVPLQRVYAVYGPDPLAVAFAETWSKLTGIPNYITRPYYTAKLMVCTIQTFKLRPVPLRNGFIAEIRPAHEGDTMAVAQCNFGFAADSAPYVLTQESAIREATFLISHHQVWIHRLTHKGVHQSDIASIVAFSRNSQTNATITKVYTNPKWRRLGCAERLIRQVCQFLLQTKTTVSSFIAHDNPGAALVYSRVGFMDMNPLEGAGPGVENWTEVGFDQAVVKLGHW